ncbi:zinc-ribbon domain-containing protein [Conyzicola sp.]|uniref:zinc-ribbon domain-containing protein n=1 Tax=Conyzicola sp. TaxID=1969404 RepID=UPI003989D661
MNPSSIDAEPRQFTCDDDHTFDYLPPAVLPNTMTPTMYTPTCGRCTARRVRPGDNDLQTANPTAAAQFDTLRNGGLTAAEVAVNSSTNHMWLCPKGHSHEVSPSKKTLPSYRCPVCSNRTIRAGENCLLTTHPEKAAMWAEGWSERRSPSALSAGSNELADWRCPEGHIFFARPWELTSGKKGCNICTRERGIDTRTSLTATHPLIARFWHPVLNGSLTAEHVTHGERRKVWWLCDEGHEHHSRIDKITLGQQCSVCSSRKLITGVNDLETVEPLMSMEYHPYLNLKAADEIFPGDQKHWWRCLTDGHNHQQTVQNRKQSKGCPKCKPVTRILAIPSTASESEDAIL